MRFKLFGVRAYFRQVNKLTGFQGLSFLEHRFPSKVSALGRRAPFQIPMRIRYESSESTAMTRQAPALYIPDFDLTTNLVQRLTQAWYKYADGKNYPRIDDDPQSLVNRVEREYRGTKVWLTTPFWSIFEPTSFRFDGVMRLIEKLPEIEQDRLRQSRLIGGIKFECFKEPEEKDLVAFLSLTGPMGLGTLACCLRIAQLTGHRRLERYVGLLLLFRVARMRKHYALAEDFDLIWSELENSLPKDSRTELSLNTPLAQHRMRHWSGFDLPRDLEIFREQVVMELQRQRRKSRGGPISVAIYDLMDFALGGIKFP
jgi:hypothetical protein